jgi:predicted deacylase
VVELSGSAPGPSTAFVSGIHGNKALGCVALTRLIDRVSDLELIGTVIVVPAVNLPALHEASYFGPDGFSINRRFPGRPSGYVSDQIAAALLPMLLDRSDCIVDIQSGTPDMALWYTYDYGDLALSSSFGYLPVIVGGNQKGQLSQAAVDAGAGSMLVEFGGGCQNDPEVGVEGCLNVLRHRHQIGGDPTGPATVPLVRHPKAYLPSFHGVLDTVVGETKVGVAVDAGVIARLSDVASGAVLEEFRAEAIGELTGTGVGFELWGAECAGKFEVRHRPILLLARSSPAIVRPGDYGCMIGFFDEELDVGRSIEGT